MKSICFLVFAALAAVPTVASADTLVFWSGSGGSGDSPEESIAYAAAGVHWTPGSVSSTGVVTPGAQYSTLTIGDVNGDGFPDIMAMIQASVGQTAQPVTIHVADVDKNGTTDWAIELDQALVYKVTFPGSLTVRKAGGDKAMYVTFVSLLPMQGSLGACRHRDMPSVSDIAIQIPAVQDPPGQTDVSDMVLTFPAAVTPPNPTGTADRESSAPSVSELTLTAPAAIDDGYQEWMNSVIQNGKDVRPVTLKYTFSDGSAITVVANLELDDLDYSTAAKKKGGTKRRDTIELLSFQFG